jgi:hypothetical protein
MPDQIRPGPRGHRGLHGKVGLRHHPAGLLRSQATRPRTGISALPDPEPLPLLRPPQSLLPGPPLSPLRPGPPPGQCHAGAGTEPAPPAAPEPAQPYTEAHQHPPVPAQNRAWSRASMSSWLIPAISRPCPSRRGTHASPKIRVSAASTRTAAIAEAGPRWRRPARCPGRGGQARVDHGQGVRLQPGDREVLGVLERVPVVLTRDLPGGAARHPVAEQPHLHLGDPLVYVQGLRLGAPARPDIAQQEFPRGPRGGGVQSEMELAFAGLLQLCELMLDYVDRRPVPRRDCAANPVRDQRRAGTGPVSGRLACRVCWPRRPRGRATGGTMAAGRDRALREVDGACGAAA